MKIINLTGPRRLFMTAMEWNSNQPLTYKKNKKGGSKSKRPVLKRRFLFME